MITIPILLAMLAVAPPVNGTPVPVLAELFTSEGCSSCPPADRLLARLATPGAVPGVEVIPLGLHVDYWDRLGWRDRFSSPEATRRQRAYGEALGLSTIYTPQLVVNGSRELVGSDEANARRALAAAAREPRVTLALSLASDPSRPAARVALALPGGAAPAEVRLAVTEDHLLSRVRAGENAGRRLEHVAVVRELIDLGEAQPGMPFLATHAVAPRPDWKRGDLSLVAFAQERGSGRVCAVARVRL